jgi:hypothetical protein
MRAVLDSGQFPHTAAYLDDLPAGFASHPQCESLAETHDGAVEIVRAEISPDRLPPEVLRLVAGEYGKGWFPEVIGMAAEMLVADVLGDDEYRRWCYDDALQLFQRPIIRHLMRLVSPTLVVMGARSRWGAVHRGTALESKPVRREAGRVIAESSLTFPVSHYPPLFLEALAHSFRAAIEGARGANVDSVLAHHEPGLARYLVSWDR